MWAFILITLSGEIFYYDFDELENAREDKALYGGVLKDKNGKEY